MKDWIMSEEENKIYQLIIKRLGEVIDPETGVDVVSMGLIPDLNVNDEGLVKYTFRPSSPLCPIAVLLALSIIWAINQVEGVSDQEITVVDYIQANELNELLKEEIKKSGKHNL